jgi:hypothetical protein
VGWSYSRGDVTALACLTTFPFCLVKNNWQPMGAAASHIPVLPGKGPAAPVLKELQIVV